MFYCCAIQNQIHGNQLRRAEQEGRVFQERMESLTSQNKGLLLQLQEFKRKQAEIECKVTALLHHSWSSSCCHDEGRLASTFS